MVHNDVKISAFPKVNIFIQIIFIIRTKNRYAQILFMKIILADIHGISPKMEACKYFLIIQLAVIFVLIIITSSS